jgi:hypothetical protein
MTVQSGGIGPEFAAASAPAYARGSGLCGQAWLTTEPVVVGRLDATPTCPRASAAARHRIEGAVCLPVTVGGTIVGTLDFFGTGPAMDTAGSAGTTVATAGPMGQAVATADPDHPGTATVGQLNALMVIGVLVGQVLERMAAVVDDQAEILEAFTRRATNHRATAQHLGAGRTVRERATATV